MGKCKCEVIKGEPGSVAECLVLRSKENCKYDLAEDGPPGKVICQAYGYGQNIYGCEFCRNVQINNGKEIGPATMYCEFGE